MTQTKFTPGPYWVMDYEVMAYGPNGIKLAIADTKVYSQNKDIETELANAHLFAAAPEMYEMLKRIIANYQEASSIAELEGYETKYEQDKYFVESLLAKARGES